jgi:hypothetical protein
LSLNTNVAMAALYVLDAGSPALAVPVAAIRVGREQDKRPAGRDAEDLADEREAAEERDPQREEPGEIAEHHQQERREPPALAPLRGHRHRWPRRASRRRPGGAGLPVLSAANDEMSKRVGGVALLITHLLAVGSHTASASPLNRR